MKRSSHVRHFLLVLTILTYLIAMIDGHPLSRLRPVYVPDDDYYYNFDFNESRSSAVNKPAMIAGERLAEDSAVSEQMKSSESNIMLKKKNSEIISALMGLRKAMSSNYGVRQVHN